MELDDQKYILNDPSWWDVDYYKKMIKYDPFLKDFKLNNYLIKLFLTSKKIIIKFKIINMYLYEN